MVPFTCVFCRFLFYWQSPYPCFVSPCICVPHLQDFHLMVPSTLWWSSSLHVYLVRSGVCGQRRLSEVVHLGTQTLNLKGIPYTEKGKYLKVFSIT